MKKNKGNESESGAKVTTFYYDWTGEEFAYIRKQAGLTQHDVALQCNKQSRQVIGRHEKKAKISMWLIDYLRMLVSPEFIVSARKRFAEGDRL